MAWLKRLSSFAYATPLIMSLGACADHPHGVLMPVLTAAGPAANRVEMLVATTRAEDPSQSILFSGARGTGVRFVDMTVSIPPDSIRKIGQVQWPKELPGNPMTDFVTRRTAPLDRPEALAWVHREIKTSPKRQVLLFVHGFNNRFEDAVYRFAQIVHDSRTEAVPVLFTWPSKASVLAYGYDRESTNYSRTQLEGVLKSLASDPAIAEVSILAHSMGNWLVLESLRQMAIRNGRVDPKIKNVLLAAPDVDVQVAREQINEMGPTRPSFSLFVSRSDKALALSKNLWGSVDRLGAIDPAKEPYRTMLAQDKIAVYDLTALETTGGMNHNTFATSPEIVQLIGSRLAAGQTITESNERFSDQIFTGATGAVSRFGDAAGLIVSAPAAVIDSDAQENYGARARSFGQGFFGE